MRPLDAFPMQVRRLVKGVLTDIDDTLTTGGRLTAEAYAAMERLHGAGLVVVPVTGRPAGWCDHIARMVAFFPHAVGTANVRDVEDRMFATPVYVTERPSGAGFAELAAARRAARG